ncbi:MAG: alpha/beta hydrolase [Planctomycetota bacterium]
MQRTWRPSIDEVWSDRNTVSDRESASDRVMLVALTARDHRSDGLRLLNWRNVLFVVLLATQRCSLCEHVAGEEASGRDEDVVVRNIAYRSSREDEDIDLHCRLDLSYPIGRSGFATVVWFHGGGLKSGEKEFPPALMHQGIAIATANYRLHPRVRSPTYIEDAAAAVAWVFENIERYGGSRRRIFVSGHSAGGYLTSMIGLDKRWLAAHQIDADEIAGLVPYSGHTITHFTVRAERGISGKQPIVDEMAPLFHVRRDAPPIRLITGDRDREMLGRYEENAYFWRMMQVVGHPDTELLELDGFDHGGMAEPAHGLLLDFIHRNRPN